MHSTGQAMQSTDHSLNTDLLSAIAQQTVMTKDKTLPLLSKNIETSWMKKTCDYTLKGHAWVHTKLCVSTTVVTVIRITVSF